MTISKLIPCEKAFAKLFEYNYLPIGCNFYLSSVRRKILETIESYQRSYGSLFLKYGTLSEDEQVYNVLGDEMKASFQSDLAELNNQEVDISFPPEKITLCVESIDKAEKGLPTDKRLGFSANDWAAIQEIIRVVEMEDQI